MKIDKRHIAFHVLTALYFIWLLLYISLVVITLLNVFGSADASLAAVLEIWLMLNFIMGAMLFIVISFYKNRSPLFTFIMYSFGSITVTAILTLILNKTGV